MYVSEHWVCKDKVEDIKQFTKSNGHKHPVLLDAAGQVGHMYGAKTTPHVFVIDRKGVLAYEGAFDDNPRLDPSKTTKNFVEEAIAALLNDSTVATSSTKPYGCNVKYIDAG